MLEKLKKIINECLKVNSSVPDPKKNLVLVIITAVCFFAALVGIWLFTGDIKFLAAAIISTIPLIIYAVYSFT